MPNLRRSFPVTRVSSQARTSARARTSRGRGVRSSRLPIGVETTYSVPAISGYRILTRFFSAMEKNSRKRVGLSVVFPAYNDAGTIASMVVAARVAARRLGGEHEIVVVNDGSSDHTAEA